MDLQMAADRDWGLIFWNFGRDDLDDMEETPHFG